MKYDLERKLKPHEEILGKYVYDYKWLTLNILCVSPKGDYFLRLVNAIESDKIGKLIAKCLEATIEEVRIKNVIQVIVNNIGICKRVGKLLGNNKYFHIISSSCITYI